MKKDVVLAIGAMRDAAVGRCRERIEQAALRARGIVGTQKQNEAKEQPDSGSQYGVTSLLKRKHGL